MLLIYGIPNEKTLIRLKARRSEGVSEIILEQLL